MAKPIPPVRRYMTPMPITIGQEQSLAVAHQLMREHEIRHLPVMDGDTLVGVLSLHDLHLIETLKDVTPETVQVEDAMTAAPYSVGPDTPLDEVVATMAEHKYGCAVIVERERVIGIFTAVDALSAFAAMLKVRLPRS
jgi:acetoin utilization protein AcuB